ncbi:MAG TPA: hypothetical protein VN408_41410 [Actinoplanes sp.]|nr:hypothetical protein [Actinoplanes sp.]
MLRLHRVEPDTAHWERQPLIFHTREWLNFITECRRAEPLHAAVTDAGQVVGHFTGLLSRRFGVHILGSPMAGWTTSYLGFTLDPGTDRRAALQVLIRFAFHEAGAAHLEIRDRGLTVADLQGLGLRSGLRRDDAPTAVIDLNPSGDALFGAMASACRRNIRKA